jgi:hypothetical protein
MILEIHSILSIWFDLFLSLRNQEVNDTKWIGEYCQIQLFEDDVCGLVNIVFKCFCS